MEEEWGRPSNAAVACETHNTTLLMPAINRNADRDLGELSGGADRGKHGGGVQEVQEEGADAAIHIEHQVGGLSQRVALHAKRVVQVARRREEAPCVVLEQRHAHVPVVLRAHRGSVRGACKGQRGTCRELARP